MIYDFKLNGITAKHDIPRRWSEVKFRHFIELDGNESKAISLFTGIEEKTLKKANITNLDRLLKDISFLNTDVPIMEFPKEIQGVKVPYDIGFENWGRYIDLKEILDKGLVGMDLVKQYPLFCAIYLGDEYDFKQAETKALELMDAPCTEVMAVGNFILMKLIALKMGTVNSSLPEGIVLRKYRLALRAWWTNMVFTVRFYILKKKLRLTEKN